VKIRKTDRLPITDKSIFNVLQKKVLSDIHILFLLAAAQRCNQYKLPAICEKEKIKSEKEILFFHFRTPEIPY